MEIEDFVHGCQKGEDSSWKSPESKAALEKSREEGGGFGSQLALAYRCAGSVLAHIMAMFLFSRLAAIKLVIHRYEKI